MNKSHMDVVDDLKKAIKLEIWGYELVISDLVKAKMKHQEKHDKLFEKQKAFLQTVTEYKSEDEINDAWGWDIITEKQRDQLLEAFRSGEEAVSEFQTQHSIAGLVLSDEINRYQRLIGELKRELMTPEEKAKQEEAAAKFKEDHENRMADFRKEQSK